MVSYSSFDLLLKNYGAKTDTHYYFITFKGMIKEEKQKDHTPIGVFRQYSVVGAKSAKKWHNWLELLIYLMIVNSITQTGYVIYGCFDRYLEIFPYMRVACSLEKHSPKRVI